MKLRCKYCKSYLSDTDKKCSNCGATNDDFKKIEADTPLTIEELKRWYINHNLPLENVSRFFVGKDVKTPKVYGIYKDETKGTYIVYKNKDDGERIIRYEGKDEQYAVNEFFVKLKDFMNNRSKFLAENNRLSNRNIKEPGDSSDFLEIILFIFLGIFVVLFIIFDYLF